MLLQRRPPQLHPGDTLPPHACHRRSHRLLPESDGPNAINAGAGASAGHLQHWRSDGLGRGDEGLLLQEVQQRLPRDWQPYTRTNPAELAFAHDAAVQLRRRPHELHGGLVNREEGMVLRPGEPGMPDDRVLDDDRGDANEDPGNNDHGRTDRDRRQGVDDGAELGLQPRDVERGHAAGRVDEPEGGHRSGMRRPRRQHQRCLAGAVARLARFLGVRGLRGAAPPRRRRHGAGRPAGIGQSGRAPSQGPGGVGRRCQHRRGSHRRADGGCNEANLARNHNIDHAHSRRDHEHDREPAEPEHKH
mmetsp:Transcript_42358/g.109405  ORF Transcript_42358/g.109405 Transcript_42358/m.109405 type:complete len:303 (-) Transcript_42358:178-1086(-)